MTEYKDYSINEVEFDKSVKQLVETVIKNQSDGNYETTEIAFSSGYLKEQEWYKRYIFEKAQEVLDVSSWKIEQIGTAYFCNKLVAAMCIKMESGKQQNLLDWREIEYIKTAFRKNIERSDRLLYDFYTCTDSELEEEFFNNTIKEWGGRFPVLAFVCFIKDRDRFVPIKPRDFKERFRRIGISTDCLNRCTWENYRKFIEIIQLVRSMINPVFGGNVELIDAHSFVWMMWHIEDFKPDCVLDDIFEQKELETCVIKKRKEGLVNLNYS